MASQTKLTGLLLQFCPRSSLHEFALLTGSNLSKILDNLEAATGGGKSPEPAKSRTSTEKKFQVKEVLTRQIMKPLLASVTKVVSEALPNLTKGVKEIGKGVEQLGKGAVDQVEKATKGMKDLFKK